MNANQISDKRNIKQKLSRANIPSLFEFVKQ